MTWTDGAYLALAVVLVCAMLVAISVALGGGDDRTSYRR